MTSSRILNSNIFSRMGRHIAPDDATLRLLDKHLLHTAKQKGPASKVLPLYGKVTKPAYAFSRSMYGDKADTAKLLGILGGVAGITRYGGEAAAPFYRYMHNIGNKINEKAISSYGAFDPTSTVNLLKPAIAATSKPFAMMDSALFNNALGMAEHPILSSLALPFTIYGGVKGGSALLSRLGRARRLRLLRQGRAPRAYSQLAQQIGYRK